MTVEEAIRRLGDCRDDYSCPYEKECFVLMKFAERRLQLNILEEEPPDEDELQYYTAPMLG